MKGAIWEPHPFFTSKFAGAGLIIVLALLLALMCSAWACSPVATVLCKDQSIFHRKRSLGMYKPMRIIGST